MMSPLSAAPFTMLMFFTQALREMYIPGQRAAYVETLRKRAFQFVEQLVPFIKLGDDVAGLILCGFRPASDV